MRDKSYGNCKNALEFTNPVLKIWVRNQGFEDSEYMFQKLGEWPEKYMLRVNPPKAITRRSANATPHKGLARRIPILHKFTLTPGKTFRIDPNPWLFQSRTGSLMPPLIRKL